MDAVRKSRIDWKVYAEAVVAHYHAHVDVTDRLVEFHVASTGDQVERCSRLNTQTVRRYLLGEIRPVSDLEESLIAALPEDGRDRVQQEILARSGLLLARIPPAAEVAQVVPACELMRRAACAVERVAPMLADNNRIGPEDRAFAVDAQMALNGVMGSCITLQAQLLVALAPQAAAARARSTH